MSAGNSSADVFESPARITMRLGCELRFLPSPMRTHAVAMRLRPLAGYAAARSASSASVGTSMSSSSKTISLHSGCALVSSIMPHATERAFAMSVE